MPNMFFNLSKILWPLLAPLNLVFILCVIAAGLLWANIRGGRMVLFFALLILTGAGILPLGHNALAALENRYQPPETLPERVAGIIVLGGAFDTNLTAVRERPVVNNNVERVLDGLYLVRRYPSAMLIFSGGEGRLRTAGLPEADIVRDFIGTLEAAPENIVYEDESRNTWENAVFSRDLLLPQPEEHWILVTSAWHMPRAMAVFRSVGWENIVPWVTDYRTTGNTYWLPRNLNIIGNFYLTELAMRECLGYLVYRFAGKES